MTLPHMPFDSTDPEDLPQGTAYPGSNFGGVLQDLSVGKFANLGGAKFPDVFFSQPAGSPLNPSMPLGFITDLFAKFTSYVAQADPATITKPPDLEALIVDFIVGLPLDALGVARNQANELSDMVRRAVSMANEALTKGYGIENGTTPVNVSFSGHRQPLGPQFYVYGDAELVYSQIGLWPPQDTGGSFVSDWVFTATQMTSDNMIAYAVLGTGGSESLDTGLYVRCNATGTSFVYANVFSNKLYLGRGSRSGGLRTYVDWLSKDVEWKVGDSLGLKAEGDVYTVYRGNVEVAKYSDTAHTATVGTGNRYIGGRVEASYDFLTKTRSESFRVGALTFVSLEAGDDTVESLNAKQRMIKNGGQVFASDSLTWYPAPGTYNIVVESWMTHLDCAVIGAGGGGGSPSLPLKGLGGGAAAWQTVTWDLSGMVGQTITLTVGAGGAGGTTGNGVAGGNSSIAATGKTTVTSTGGAGGGRGYPTTNGANSSSSTFVGQTLPGAEGGGQLDSGSDFGNGAPGVAPGAGGGGCGANGGHGGKGGDGRALLQLRTASPSGEGYNQITGWVSDPSFPATITDDALVTAIIGSGADEFTITGRCRASITSSSDPMMQLRVNDTPIGTAVYSVTGSNQDRTCVVYDVPLEAGDEVTMWIKGINGSVQQTNTDLTITPTT